MKLQSLRVAVARTVAFALVSLAKARRRKSGREVSEEVGGMQLCWCAVGQLAVCRARWAALSSGRRVLR
jgi:hypothetical protein